MTSDYFLHIYDNLFLESIYEAAKEQIKPSRLRFFVVFYNLLTKRKERQVLNKNDAGNRFTKLRKGHQANINTCSDKQNKS